MSVPKSQREDKSDVCYLASQLELKIIRMVLNEKYFPKRARFVISNKLVDLATDVSINYDAANDIFPNTEDNTEEKLETREKFQIIGRAKFVALKKQLNIAYQLFNIPGGVIGEVFDLTSQIEKKYSNWFKSGRKVLKRELNRQQEKDDDSSNE